MIGYSITTAENFLATVGPKSPAVKKAQFKSFGHAGASIRRDAIASILYGGKKPRFQKRRRAGRKSDTVKRFRASPAGTPPFYHINKGFVRKGIAFAASQETVVIGPTKSGYGESMSAHEHGGEYMGAKYPQRPFMGPAMDRNLYRFGSSWSGAIGQ
jgi:hypothetical protein